jgi:hypothetical protein
MHVFLAKWAIFGLTVTSGKDGRIDRRVGGVSEWHANLTLKVTNYSETRVLMHIALL